MTRGELIRWRDLTPADHGAWRAFRDARATLAGPYHAPGWFETLERARGDLWVLRARSSRGETTGFLPLHLGWLGGARRAGRPLGDRHGFIAPPNARLDAPRLLRDAGLHAYRFRAAPPDDPGLGVHAVEEGACRMVDLSSGFGAYAAPTAGGAPRAIRGRRRGLRKLEEDGRDLRFVFDDRSREAFDGLLRQKQAQYRRTRMVDVLAWPWARRVLADVFAQRGETFEGRLSSLWIDGHLAAAHLGLRSGAVLHYWIGGYDDQLARYSPGVILAVELAREAARMGVTQIDLGIGESQFKREFGDRALHTLEGVACAEGPGGRVHSWAARVGRGGSWPVRALKRLDYVSAAWTRPAHSSPFNTRANSAGSTLPPEQTMPVVRPSVGSLPVSTAARVTTPPGSSTSFSAPKA